jgi:hypothetical protein
MSELCLFNDEMKCSRCGYVAASLPTFRQCEPPVVGVARSARASLPGTELSKLLRRFGITATPDCSCNTRAAEMDRQGVEWCEANIDTIVGWLREQATARGLPFLDVAGRLLVRRAISNARKAAAGG